MKSRNPVGLLLPVMLLAATSCQKPADVQSTPGAAADAATQPTSYQVKGLVREVHADKKKVTIAHEKIPGYMAAMTMEFNVTNATELAGVSAGDEVTFRMTVTADDGWIDQIRRTGVTTPPPPASSFRRAREVDPLTIGDVMPEYTFTNQLGNVVRLSQYKGQAYVLNFIFTRCPFPTFCPRQSKSLSEAQEQLKSKPDAQTNWHFLSITIDPAYDTPARLKGYARTYNADPEKWTFLTGDLEDITAITEQFGMQFWRDTPDALPNHNVRTIVVDATGHIQWLTVENEWKSETLVEQVLIAMKPKP